MEQSLSPFKYRISKCKVSSLNYALICSPGETLGTSSSSTIFCCSLIYGTIF